MKSELVQCPWCKEDDFDLFGLKLHVDGRHCEVYNATNDQTGTGDVLFLTRGGIYTVGTDGIKPISDPKPQ